MTDNQIICNLYIIIRCFLKRSTNYPHPPPPGPHSNCTSAGKFSFLLLFITELSWMKHIKSICAKVRKKFGNALRDNQGLKLYTSLVWPHLKHASPSCLEPQQEYIWISQLLNLMLDARYRMCKAMELCL